MQNTLPVEKIRKDFPLLNKKGKKIIYFDTACMALKPIQVINAISKYYYNYPVCAERSVYKLAVNLSMECELVREKIKKFLNSERTEEIVFTKNTTEGINTIAKNLHLKKNDIVLTTDKEHNSNLLPWQELRKFGVKHHIVFSNEDNTFNIENFKRTMNRKVKLVSMVHKSNLDGYTIPAKEIIEIAHDYGALVLLDGAQSAPYQKIDVKKLDVDFFVFSLHKLCGPTGVGILYGKYELFEKMSPLLVGGGSVKNTTYENSTLLGPPLKFEAGIQNYAGILGAGAAIDYVSKIGLENINAHATMLNKMVTKELGGEKDIGIIGPSSAELRGGTFSFNIKNMDSHDVAIILEDSANILIRSGMHCVHSWFNHRKINGCARASFYFYNTKSEVKIFVENVRKIIENF